MTDLHMGPPPVSAACKRRLDSKEWPAAKLAATAALASGPPTGTGPAIRNEVAGRKLHCTALQEAAGR